MENTWRLMKKMEEAHGLTDFSYLDHQGHRVEVHIDDHHELCADTDLL